MLHSDFPLLYIGYKRLMFSYADPTMNIPNILCAVESISNADLAEAVDVPVEKLQHLTGSGNLFKELLLTHGLSAHPAPTWEFLSGKLYHYGHEKALHEVKKHITRKLGSFMCFCQ